MTDNKIQIRPYPLGAHREANGIRFSCVSKADDCGVILYDRNSGRKLEKIPFLPEEKMGNVRYKWVPDIDVTKVSYQFYENDRVIPDPYAGMFTGKLVYGRKHSVKEMKAGILSNDFEWGQDRNPKIPYEDCIVYCLHVRGFTKHLSSQVSGRGTFQGLTEKLPYLKKLGITTLELQPAYEFLELEEKAAPDETLRAAMNGKPLTEKEDSLNYWGYKEGYYYTPKQAYTAGEDASLEFKEMVKAVHSLGMELVLQFYFPEAVSVGAIPDILRFWVYEYHVDGFHLMGSGLPVDVIARDPALADTKLWYYEFPMNPMDSMNPMDKIYGKEERTGYRNLALYRDEYMYDMRRFLKGDSDMLPRVLSHMRKNPEGMGQLNFFTNYYGFTLMDLVSYDRKHNEENGEENRDGTDYNHSWNCGCEGNSRKKQIMSLRKKQIKNALCMLFLSQATPLIFMGDEFGNSQNGNNNPYCQDNAVAWLNWKDLEKNKELYDFTAKLIALRKAHPVLHQEKELRIMDYLSYGYPDLSYHGEAAWRPCLENYSRHVGIMYSGKYAKTDKGDEDVFFYVALNMHWEEHDFAMPRLPKGVRWEMLLQTEEQEGRAEEEENCQCRRVAPRSVAVFVSAPEETVV